MKLRRSERMRLMFGAPWPVACQRAICGLGLPLGKKARSMAKYKDAHKGRRAFVIGNGPSLRMSDLDVLKDEITFASNKISLAFQQTDWRPTYHCIENEHAIAELADELRMYKHQLFLSAKSIAKSGVIEGAGYYVRDLHTNPTRPLFQPRPLGHVYCGYSVLYSCIQIGYFMGIREFYLLGVDFSYSTAQAKALPTESGQTQQYESGGEVNHFHADYKKAGQTWSDPNLQWQEIAFRHAGDVLARDGGFVKNATRGGRLEVLERADFDSLF